jgi:hypothetical protein
VSQVRGTVLEKNQGACGTHPAQVRRRLRLLPDRSIHFAKQVLELTGLHPRLCSFLDHSYCRCRRDISSEVTADTVRDREDRLVCKVRVLIVVSHPADVALGAYVDIHLRISSTVFPIFT